MCDRCFAARLPPLHSSHMASGKEWIYAMWRQPVERQRDMLLGLEPGCLMQCLCGDTLHCGLLGCRVSAPVGLPGHFSAVLFFTKHVATYTIGCSLPPPARAGKPAMNKVKELSARYVAIRCSTCFLWRPIVSSGADFSLGWLTNCSTSACLPALIFLCMVTYFTQFRMEWRMAHVLQ